MKNRIRDRGCLMFAWIAHTAATVERVALSLARTWWRPAMCWTVIVSVGANGVYLPLSKGVGLDFSGFALLVTAITPWIAVRAYEKVRGVA